MNFRLIELHWLNASPLFWIMQKLWQSNSNFAMKTKNNELNYLRFINYQRIMDMNTLQDIVYNMVLDMRIQRLKAWYMIPQICATIIFHMPNSFSVIWSNIYCWNLKNTSMQAFKCHFNFSVRVNRFPNFGKHVF